MYRILSASKDTYITNKIVNNTFRATDANTGQAGTLDLFKLYDESTLGGDFGEATIRIVNSNRSSLDDGSPPSITLISTDGTERTYKFQNGGSFANGVTDTDDSSGKTVRWYGTNASAGHNQGDFASFLKSAIEGAAGHGNKLTVTLSTDSVSGITNDTLTIKQATLGAAGNTTITITNPNASDLLVNGTAAASNNFIGGEDKEGNLIEISKLLLKFDLDVIKNLHTKGDIDVNDPSFSCTIKLHDVYGGQTTPENFRVVALPLAKSFDEGTGFDIVNFNDATSCNFITASIQNGSAITWEKSHNYGARKVGTMGDSNIDAFASGTLESSVGKISLSGHQFFVSGEEDLEIDMTNYVSGVVANKFTDHGVILSLSGAFETNEKSYFVKRFASRNSLDTSIRPKLILKFDDSVMDNHNNFIFDVTGSLFLNNFHGNNYANIVTPSTPTGLIGHNCLRLKIESGSYKKIFQGSQFSRGTKFLDGIYSSSFALSSYDANLKAAFSNSNSIVFNEIWTNATETETYLSSSITISKPHRTSFSNSSKRVILSFMNLRDSYNDDENVRLRIFLEDRDREISYSKLPLEKPSNVYDDVHYRVVDALNGNVMIPFDTLKKSTKLSSDKDGMYFVFSMASLPRGRNYRFDFLLKINNENIVIKDTASNFSIR